VTATPAGGTSTAEGTGLSRWTVAAADTRTAAKWMIGSLASAAALIFGAGTIVSRPALSWAKDACQLVIALAAGTVGLVSVVLLVGLTATVLTPVKISLEEIPKEMLRDLNAAADIRLPSGSRSYGEFLLKYRQYTAISARLAGQLAELGRAGSHSSKQRTQLAELHKAAQHNVDVYTRAAESYLNQAEFYSVSHAFRGRRLWTLILAVGAALGALGYQLALAAEPGNSSDVPELAYLVAPRDPSELWNELDLGSCAVDGKVPVLVSGGQGSNDHPYSVTIIKVNPRCTPKSFDLRDGALTLEKLQSPDVTVHYKPLAS
jgi:hypothetical protein